jgi:hypothetical protein
MSDEPTPQRSRSRSRITVLLVLLVLYVLSPQPLVQTVFWLGSELDSIGLGFEWETFEAVFFTVYAPLIWLYENVPAVEWFYDWYGELFE